jgi:glucokinase
LNREGRLKYIVGVDIGGTNLVTGCVSENGISLEALHSEPTRPEDGSDAVIGRIIDMAKHAMAECKRANPAAEIIGIGVGAPGPLNTKSGIVLLTPNLGWVNMPLRDRIQEGVGLPAALDNDANCAVLGEWWMGAARGTRIAIGVTIGTGIGGGLILNGRLFHGHSDCAGEIGHTTIEVNGRRCKCGNYGCLEAYASGPAIARRAIEAIESGYETSLPRYVDGRLELITAQTVYDAAHDGDVLALEVVSDPEVVVICGGVTYAGDSLFVPLRRELSRRAFKPAVEVCRVVPGELSGTAGVYGAARAFIEQSISPASRSTDRA